MDLREKMARALYDHAERQRVGLLGAIPWDKRSETLKLDFLNLADIAIRTYNSEKGKVQ